MIFQHTIDKVLSGEKIQTSRLWQANWELGYQDAYDRPSPYDALYNFRIGDVLDGREGRYRKLYYVGQTLSVQPGRGKHGVARIRITNLAKADVRNFDAEDIAREGFATPLEFYLVWTKMHDILCHDTLKSNQTLALQWDVIGGWWQDNMANRPAKAYQVLVIRFELVQEKELA